MCLLIISSAVLICDIFVALRKYAVRCVPIFEDRSGKWQRLRNAQFFVTVQRYGVAYTLCCAYTYTPTVYRQSGCTRYTGTAAFRVRVRVRGQRYIGNIGIDYIGT